MTDYVAFIALGVIIPQEEVLKNPSNKDSAYMFGFEKDRFL
jgi:hypothetical protein